MNYYTKIKNNLIEVEIHNKVKDYSKTKYTLEKYYEIGKLIIEAQGGERRAKYGDGLIKEYSKRLTKELGKNVSERTLIKMRKFYSVFRKFEITPQMAAQLSWSHFDELLVLNNIEIIKYYINRCINSNLSRNKLREIIKNQEYERLPEDTRQKLIKKEELTIKDTIKNPIIIKNNIKSDIDNISEKVLHKLILEDIETFMNELGNGYAFIGHEYKIKIGDRNNYIDFLFFNTKFNSYVVLEVKITEFKAEYIGQIKKYMTYIDKKIKTIYNNNTIGIIMCKKDNELIFEYVSDERIFKTTYKLK